MFGKLLDIPNTEPHYRFCCTVPAIKADLQGLQNVDVQDQTNNVLALLLAERIPFVAKKGLKLGQLLHDAFIGGAAEVTDLVKACVTWKDHEEEPPAADPAPQDGRQQQVDPAAVVLDEENHALSMFPELSHVDDLTLKEMALTKCARQREKPEEERVPQDREKNQKKKNASAAQYTCHHEEGA